MQKHTKITLTTINYALSGKCRLNKKNYFKEDFHMSKIIKVGVMPGKIQEVAVKVGTPVSEVLSLVNLNPTGFDVKVDGSKIDDTSTLVAENTNLILLVKQVKGNY